MVLLSSLLGRDWFYRLIGILNKHILSRPIKSVFLLYPANEKYTEAYVYHWYAKTMKWSPRLVGLLRQKSSLGLVFGISASDDDFINPTENGNLELVEKRLHKIMGLLHAAQ